MDKKEYIEREKIRGILHSIINDSNCPMYMLQVYDQMLDHIPAADVQEVKRGKWLYEYKSGTPIKEGVVSSCCDMWNNYRTNFCPHCGARMDGEEK